MGPPDPRDTEPIKLTTAHSDIHVRRTSQIRLPHRQKLGRNDPCPCGSMLKYKKCCLVNKAVRQAAADRLMAKVAGA